MSTLYTIGHSTRSLDELVAALKAHGVGTLVDIRAFPMSRRMPHFNRESLEIELPQRGIRYVWMKELGGHRKKILPESPNTGLRNESFRNYADYMLTEEFERAIERLLRIVEETAGLSNPARKSSAPTLRMTSSAAVNPTLSPNAGEEDGAPGLLPPVEMTSSMGLSDQPRPHTAYMCAERVYFQCHRMLVSDYLTARGYTVLHIDDERRAPRLHKLMAEAHLVDGKLLYNAQQLF